MISTIRRLGRLFRVFMLRSILSYIINFIWSNTIGYLYPAIELETDVDSACSLERQPNSTMLSPGCDSKTGFVEGPEHEHSRASQKSNTSDEFSVECEQYNIPKRRPSRHKVSNLEKDNDDAVGDNLQEEKTGVIDIGTHGNQKTASPVSPSDQFMSREREESHQNVAPAENETTQTFPNNGTNSPTTPHGAEGSLQDEDHQQCLYDKKQEQLYDKACEKFEYFWKSDSVFSQWYQNSFEVGGITYNCAEQYMMHQKAELVEDLDTAKKILKAKSPKQQKALGRKIKNFNEDLWSSNCKYIVKTGNRAKFRSDHYLKEQLYATYPRDLVEASPLDTVWGIGLTSDDPAAWSRETWLGQNLLGQALTEVRNEMMKEDGIIPIDEYMD
ncbi:hypothetical protein ScPMuIL_018070 [Solemya velum]